METQDDYNSTSHAPQPSNAQQFPLRVNPNRPLPSSLPGSETAQQNQSFLPEDAPTSSTARTAARRRKVSGKVPSQADSISQPAVPEISNDAPASSIHSYTNGHPSNPTNQNLASFAERARAAPSDLILANLPEVDLTPVAQKIRPIRRGSINRPPGAVYSEIRGTERKALSSPRANPRFSQYSPNPTAARQISDSPNPTAARQISGTESKPLILSSTTAKQPTTPGDTTSLPSRSNSKRVSVEPGTEWAAHRSPLQKLEVKLNDISKEEKRARVEEAEQMLKESKAGVKSRNRSQADSNSSRRHSRHVPASTDGRLKNPASNEAAGSLPKAPVLRDLDPTDRPYGEPRFEEPRNVSRSNRQGYPTDAEASPRQKITQDSVQAEKPLSHVNKPPSLRTPIGSPESGYQSGRSVRFQGSAPSTNSDRAAEIQPKRESAESGDHHLKTTSIHGTADLLARREQRLSPQNNPLPKEAKVKGRLMTEQHREFQGKNVESSNLGVSRASTVKAGNAADPDPERGGRSNDNVLRYEKGPINMNAINAHKKYRPHIDLQRLGGSSAQRRSHISNTSQRRENSTLSRDIPRTQTERLDEWRRGGVARLTIADSKLGGDSSAGQSAWWEGGKDGTGKSFDKNRVGTGREAKTFGGGLDETYGKDTSPISLQGQSSNVPSAELDNGSGSVHVRPYVENGGEPTGLWNGLKWLKDRGPLFSTSARKDPRFFLSHVYSYSCPELAEHDIFHPYHICKPYVSKELTRSMRSTRIRIAPPSTSFDPKLYLKCGPLLRYTGLKRYRLEGSANVNADSSVERESWRGSVMIVTVDADSSYHPPPTLRLFHEPLDPLPPPPQRVDNDHQTGQGIPSEHIDPVAGLPKLSRTGTTIYVKPVEDLEQEVDLSRVEDDSGLFEETRTAAVPTSYGQAASRVRQNGVLSFAQNKNRRGDRAGSTGYQEVRGVRLHAGKGATFWRFNLEVELGEKQARIAYQINKSASVGFWVPARGQSMNIMFHTCNGFSMNIE